VSTPVNGQLQKCNNSRLSLRQRFLTFFKGALLLIFKKVVEHVLLSMGIQKLKNVFVVIFVNLNVWLNVLWRGADTINAE